MWFFKLLFLLCLLASWIPRESESASPESMYQDHVSLDYEAEEPEEEEENEELAA